MRCRGCDPIRGVQWGCYARPMCPARLADDQETILSFEQFKQTPQFAGLDVLRGFSILLVIWHHGFALAPDAWLHALRHNGRHGVALFFVISGFLIASLLLREREETGRIRLGRFYLGRTLRLLPLYYAMLGVHVFLVRGLGFYTPANQGVFDDKFWSYIFYFSNWLPMAGEGPFFQSWSLAAEEQFYLVFAAGVVWLRPRWLVAVVGGLLAMKVALFVALPGVEAAWPATRAIFSYQEPILLGVLLAYALNNRRIYAEVRGFAGPLLPLAALTTAALLLGKPTVTYTGWDAEAIYGAMTLLVAACVMRRRVAFRYSDVVAHIGKVSYGIYLLHMVAISAAKKVPFIDDPYTCFAVAVVVVVPVATCVHEWFEARIIRFYKARFGAGRGTASPLPVRVLPLLPRA